MMAFNNNRKANIFADHLITAWISNHMPSKVWDEIFYAFPNFNGLHRWSLEMDK